MIEKRYSPTFGPILHLNCFSGSAFKYVSLHFRSTSLTILVQKVTFPHKTIFVDKKGAKRGNISILNAPIANHSPYLYYKIACIQKNNIYNNVDSYRAGGLHAWHAFHLCKRPGTFITATFLPSPIWVLCSNALAGLTAVVAGSLRITSSWHRL